MGTLRHGLLGNYKGKVGNLVFYELKGKQVVRTLGKSKDPASPGQLQNRQEMVCVMGFLKPLREFINVGFASMASGSVKTPYNMAVSYNKMNAVTGSYNDIAIDYEKVLVTQGGMVGPDEPAVELTDTGLSFTWTCPRHLEWPRPNDQVMLMVYFPDLQRVEYVLYGARRIQCAEVLSLPANVLGERMEVYISFIAENRKQVSDSIYLGRFNG